MCRDSRSLHPFQSSEVSGFTVGTSEHKIGLHADDIILICSSPTKSLITLLKILEGFSLFFYYKLNKSKSHILPLTSPSTQKSTLATFTFLWAETFVLGIELTLSPSQTIHLSFQHLLAQTEKVIKRLSLCPIFWMARINLCKILLSIYISSERSPT